ncbi:MAG: tetratricopeptide repeat protein [Planctomycetes bacterium]|nr:tetratricopeptide repeat protein [Planctomycetota bacterium]
MRKLLTVCLFLVFTCGALLAQADIIAKAEAHREKGEHQQAVDVLSAGYDSISKDAKALWMLADSYYQLEDNDRAVQNIVKATDLAPTEAKYQKTAAQIFYARAEETKAAPGATSGKIESYFEEALNFARAAIKLDPKDLESLSLAGESAWNINKPADSAAFYEQAALVDPSESNHQFFAARGHRAAKNFGQALECLNKGLKLKPTAAWFHREKGHVLLESGGAMAGEQAAQAYQEALCSKDLDEDTVMQAAQGLWATRGAVGDFVGGQKAMEAWAAAHPTNARAKWWVGYYLAQQKKHKEAVAAFSAACDAASGQYPEAALEAGNSAKELGDLDNAAEWWGKAQKLAGAASQDQRGSFSVLTAVGPHFESSQFEKAISMLEKYSRNAPPNYSVYNNLGFAYREQGSARQRESKAAAKAMFTKSSDWYEKASAEVVKLEGVEGRVKAQTLNDTGLMYHYHLEDIAKGIAFYKRALEFDASFGDALENLAMCFNIQGRYEEALPLLEKLLKAEPARMVGRRELEKARKGLEKK